MSQQTETGTKKVAKKCCLCGEEKACYVYLAHLLCLNCRVDVAHPGSFTSGTPFLCRDEH
jgi:hypothetical protein